MEDKKKKLADAFLAARTQEDVWFLLEDLCTIKEAEDMANRFAIAQMLSDGKTFVEIEAITHSSSATISRVNRSLKHGQGYRAMIKRLSADSEEQQ